MPQRNYKAEYKRRLARAKALGLSRSQARGHPKSGEQSTAKASRAAESRLKVATKAMNRGASLTMAARATQLSPKLLRTYLRSKGLLRRKGRRWVIADRRLRRVLVTSRGRQRSIVVDRYEESQLAGSHHDAIGRFVRTNDISLIRPFEGRYVRSANGQKHPLETDPNELHRIAAMDNRRFEEIYNITARR